MVHARFSRRLVAILCALVLVLLPLTAIAQRQPERTSVQYFLPFNSEGLVVGLAVTGQVRGSCFAGSVADPGRPDAWRCTDEQNAIHDPCFENPYHPAVGGNVLACAENPWDANVVLLTLTQPLSREKANKLDTSAMPWALELANGESCTPLTGTSILIAGQRVNYSCTNGGSILGEPERGSVLWRVHYLTDTRSSSTATVDVVTAWY
jgi:hypothetical protein